MVTLGTDPEVFVVRHEDGTCVPSFDVLSALTASPSDGLVLPFGHLIGDGAALEWTQHPTASPDEAAYLTLVNLAAVRDLVASAGKAWDLSLSPCVKIRADTVCDSRHCACTADNIAPFRSSLVNNLPGYLSQRRYACIHGRKRVRNNARCFFL